uniref:Nucleoside phosphorylase domain-containing protein n=1 Tax=Bionectria ochroleuca TaxID=29856 RepID=A0A8H7K8A9_BIOOC
MNYGSSYKDFENSSAPGDAARQLRGSRAAKAHDDYDVAWICALYLEMAAARAMLDITHDDLPMHPSDSNCYILGSIERHNVVIACLPDAQYGTNNAANVAANLLRTFPSVRVGLMVGIGGGVPTKADVRLGDVVVGSRVMQYDMGKITDGGIQRTAVPRLIPRSIGTIVSKLRAVHENFPSRIPEIMREKLRGSPNYCHPKVPDRLFESTYMHRQLVQNSQHPNGSQALTCDECDKSRLQPRYKRPTKEPYIHYGAIASGNQVVKDASIRDQIARDLDVICFEMEAAGLMDTLPCLIIRGICDYSDSHKSKEWQRYAAATAAAYARELLEISPVNQQIVNVTVDLPRSRNHRKRLLESLRFDQMDSRRETIRNAYGPTCRWFLNHPDYLAWLDPKQLPDHNGFLWVSGKPGAGKSTIMKFTFAHMAEENRSKITPQHRPDSCFASFFFNARGESLERTITGMYRSLLIQLLEWYKDLQAILDDYKLDAEKRDNWFTLDTLKTMFQKAVLSLGKREFTCFIDALDECDEQQAIDMIQYFEDLTEESTEKDILFRVCFSSRHYPYIDIQGSIRLKLEDQPGHNDDLQMYVRRRLKVRDASMLEELYPLILEKAAGVFLWVALVIRILNKEDRYGRPALKKRVTDLPSDLSELFKDMITRDYENTEELQLSVLWVLYAERSLRPDEYYHALWAGLYSKGLMDSEIPTTSTMSVDSMARIERYVISSSKGLAEITKSDHPIVQFIHESVRDFLIKDGGLRQLWPGLDVELESPGHERLKICCDTYITHPKVRETVSKLPWNTAGLKKLTFLRYASQHIMYHANIAAKAIAQDDFLTRFCKESWPDFPNVFDERKYAQNTSILYFLAEKGYPTLIQTALISEPEINTPGEEHGYPLFAALANRHIEAAAALLGSNTSIFHTVDFAQDFEDSNHRTAKYRSRTPLTWAAQSGHREIVELLLKKGSSPNEVDGGGKTPLSRAAMHGTAAVVETLVNHGANINGENIDGVNTGVNGGWTPLLLALNKNHEALARLLVDSGADINVTTSISGWTPLLLALHNGYKALSILLIEGGANIKSTTSHGWTPLLLASKVGSLAIIDLLVNLGADINLPNQYGWTPISLAAENGHQPAAELLIKLGADINSSDQEGHTPLLLALYEGHEPMATMLVQQGADVTYNNSLPLVLASKNRFYELETLMIQEKR